MASCTHENCNNEPYFHLDGLFCCKIHNTHDFGICSGKVSTGRNCNRHARRSIHGVSTCLIHMPKGNEESLCSICLEDCPDVKPTICGHFFHAKCMAPWKKEHDTCPTCRAPLKWDKPPNDVLELLASFSDITDFRRFIDLYLISINL